jgi:dynein heavy chain, axonemal
VLLAASVTLSKPVETCFEWVDLDMRVHVADWTADSKRVMTALEHYLATMDTRYGPPPKIVFFPDAIQHILRLARILRQPGANSILLGVGGSGRQTLARLAASVAGCAFMRIQKSRGSGHTEFRDGLRQVMDAAGVDGTRCCLLLTDEDLPTERYMEDINSLLNTGDAPRLFSPDECDAIFGKLRQWFSVAGVSSQRHDMYQAFVQRARSNLHIVLCISPAGERFRSQCRQYPALVNCCTVDWYPPWPEAALQAVAMCLLSSSVDMGSDAIQAITSVAPKVHASVTCAAQDFDAELSRKVYVTPQSYLDQLTLFTRILKKKRAELSRNQGRISNGLQRMRDTEAVVIEMEKELQALAPSLEEKTARTSDLLKGVATEQEDAAQIKAAISREEASVKKSAQETEVC